MRTLADRSISAAKWSLAGNFGRAAFQFSIGIILARILGPEAFGLIAIGWLAVNMGMLVADAGFAAAIVQKPQLSDAEIDFVFTVQVAFGLLLTAGAIAASGPVSVFFKEPDAEPVINAMSALFVIRALGQTATALLSRELRHKVVQVSTVVSYSVGFAGVAIPMALMGSGVWSLVFGSLAQASLSSLIVIAANGRLPRFGLRFSGEFFRFGGQVLAANIGSWIILNVDTIFVGRNQSTESLGIYNRALMLVAQPAASAVTALQGVLFASCSRAEADASRIIRAYRTFSAAVGFLCFPAFLTIAAIPETTILAIYGPKWGGAVKILPPLALAMSIHAVLALVGPVLMSLNRTRLEVLAQYTAAAIAVPVMAFASAHSLEMVSWAVLLIYITRLSLLFVALNFAIRISFLEMIIPLIIPFLMGACCALISREVDTLLRGLDASSRLLIDVGCAGITILLLMRVFRGQLLKSDVGVLFQGKDRLPRPLQKWLGA